MTLDIIIQKLEKDSNLSIDRFRNEIAKIRTGRANLSILDSVMIDNYGTPTPIKQVAHVSLPEARQILIKPFDRANIKAIIKAIVDHRIEVNPQDDGDKIRLNFPALTEETRKDMGKKVHAIAEQAKVSLRGIRKDAKDQIKKVEEAKSKDYEKFAETEIQKSHDKFIKQVEDIAKNKETELQKI